MGLSPSPLGLLETQVSLFFSFPSRTLPLLAVLLLIDQEAFSVRYRKILLLEL